MPKINKKTLEFLQQLNELNGIRSHLVSELYDIEEKIDKTEVRIVSLVEEIKSLNFKKS